MGSIEEALKTAGAEDDLQTILRVLENKSVGFTRSEAAAGLQTWTQQCCLGLTSQRSAP